MLRMASGAGNWLWAFASRPRPLAIGVVMMIARVNVFSRLRANTDRLGYILQTLFALVRGHHDIPTSVCPSEGAALGAVSATSFTAGSVGSTPGATTWVAAGTAAESAMQRRLHDKATVDSLRYSPIFSRKRRASAVGSLAGRHGLKLIPQSSQSCLFFCCCLRGMPRQPLP